MSKERILILIAAAISVLVLIGIAVHVLYSGVPDTSDSSADSPHAQLLRAVPSDAAAVMCFSDIRKGIDILSNPEGEFSILFGRTGSPRFLAFVDSLSKSDLKGVPAAISMHFSGNVEPLMIVSTGRSDADTSALEINVVAIADSLGLKHETVNAERKLLLVSASETLVGSAQRHIDHGTSILDNKSFAAVCEKVKGNNTLYVSHDYAKQLAATYVDRPLRKYADFIKRMADWTALDFVSAGEYRLSMRGSSSFGRSDAYYMRLMDAMPKGETCLGEILPARTCLAVSLTDADFDKFSLLYEDYLDAVSKLSSRRKRLDTLSAEGLNPLQWRKKVSVREVARVEWESADTQYVALFVRTGEKSRGKQEITDNKYKGFVAALYGDVFAIPDESCELSAGNWKAFGGEDALYDWMNEGRMNVSFPAGDCFANVVIPPAVMQWKDGEWLVSAAPAVSLEGDGEKVAATPGIVPDKGPFKVTNCATGKQNEFYQNDHMALCLKDEKGRGLWGVPFGKPICGCVGEIDRFKNGKIQFVFCTGSQLYAIDRLGRFVKGFPVSLGKEVLVGPVVYDFSGSREYAFMVLHTDNSIGLYGIDGKISEGWKGIQAGAAVVALPEQVKYEGNRYWVLKTSEGQYVYEFNGGEPLKGKVARNILK